MNKKQLIVAAMAAMLSVSCANAESNITGVTGVGGNGTSGIFNIAPDKIGGDVGYRHYNDFTLGKGDVANLIYQGMKNGQIRDIETFINLVGNKIDIQGILNTMRDGKFHDGHAVFISPKGMVVGASGVLNVGTLSVITPTDDKFKELKESYDRGNVKGIENNGFEVIKNISNLRNGAGNNYGGNAPVNIKGTVIARNGVDIRGSQVDITGGIVNGYKGADVFDATINEAGLNQAQVLFNQLVNTDGLITANADQIANNKGTIVIKSGANVGEHASNINISGRVANLNNTETAITNHGDQGLTVSGAVSSNGKLNIYNNNTVSNLLVSGKLNNKNAALSVSNKGADLEITKDAVLTSDNDIEIVNNGKVDTSELIMRGTILADGKIDVVNRGAGGMTASGNYGTTEKLAKSVRIVNENGKLVFSGNANAKESVSLRNQLKGTGMDVAGTINAGEGVLVHNKVGNAELSGDINVETGNVVVMNEGNGKLTTTEDSNIYNERGNVAIKNTAQGGMELNGNIYNEGEVAINNLAGEAIVNGYIENKGNMGVINKENGTGLTIGAAISNEGKIKLVNSTGAGGMTINGNIQNKMGDLYVYNDAGRLTINGILANTEAGNLYVLSRKASKGITTGVNSVISNDGDDIAIKHNGSDTNGDNVGMELNGKIINNGTGETAINNYTGDMKVGGTIQAGTKTLGIINRAASEDRAKTGRGGQSMEVTANITGHDINIKNNGSGDMTVGGTINHDGRLNILANEGDLTLEGTINNTGKDMTYAAARANGDGIYAKPTFVVNATNGGTVLIKNITGQNGLKYEGTINAGEGQAEIYNKTGDMTVSGSTNSDGSVTNSGMTGNPVVILNTGNKLTVTEDVNLNGTDIKIVNKGTESADVATQYQKYLREQLKK